MIGDIRNCSSTRRITVSATQIGVQFTAGGQDARVEICSEPDAGPAAR
jgi:hypothetical protein